MTDSTNPFRVVLRGYDPAQVDRRMRELEGNAETARQQVGALEQRVQELADLLEEARSKAAEETPAAPVSFTHLGERVGQILSLADEEAEELRRRARDEVAAHRAQEEEAVAGIRAEVGRYAEQRRSDAETEAARIVEDARRSADERLDAAERDAAARIQEAEAVYETQRAKAAKAAADFETTLAMRRKKAEDEFTQQMEEAQQRLEELQQHTERSRAEAEAAQAEAAREARKLVDDAEQQARTIVSEAKTVAARVRADSERELAAATQRRDSINAQLANVRQMLTTLSGVAPAALMDQALGVVEKPVQTDPEASADQADEHPDPDGDHQVDPEIATEGTAAEPVAEAQEDGTGSEEPDEGSAGAEATAEQAEAAAEGDDGEDVGHGHDGDHGHVDPGHDGHDGSEDGDEDRSPEEEFTPFAPRRIG